MSDPLRYQHGLLGGLIVRRAFVRLGRIVDHRTFESGSDRVVYVTAKNLAACGLDADETFVEHIADAMHFSNTSRAPLKRALETFCELADEHEDWTLEDLARSVAAGGR